MPRHYTGHYLIYIVFYVFNSVHKYKLSLYYFMQLSFFLFLISSKIFIVFKLKLDFNRIAKLDSVASF